MQFGSYLRVMAGTMGFFGVILTILGMVCLRANRTARLAAVPREKLSLEQVKKLMAQNNRLISGITLVVLFILGLVLPWVFNLAERQIIEGHYGIAMYAAIALGVVISIFVYGFVVAFNEWRVEKRRT